jgi:Double zinc ribbon
MKFNDKAAVRASPNSSGVGPKAASEIDLYDELVAFLKLSPAQKLRYFNRPDTRSSKDTTQYAASEPVGTAISEQVDVEVVEPASESNFTDEVPKEDGETGQSSPRVADEFSAGATLAEMNPQYVFTNALSGQDCPTCGAQSEADDLFCMSCGGFLNGVGSALPFDPSCTDCSRDIQPDEIFCPWCGSTLSGG